MNDKPRKYKWMVTLAIFGICVALFYLVLGYFTDSSGNPFSPLIFVLWVPLGIGGFILGSIADAIPKSKFSKTEKIFKIVFTVIIFAWLIYQLLIAAGVI